MWKKKKKLTSPGTITYTCPFLAHCLRRVLFLNLHSVMYELRGAAAGMGIHNVRVESSMAQQEGESYKQDRYLFNWL